MLALGCPGARSSDGGTGGGPGGTGGVLCSIAHADGGWVAAGTSNGPLILSSFDAVNWQREMIPEDGGGIFDVAFANGVVVAVGSGGGSNSTIYVHESHGWLAQAFPQNLEQVISGNGLFLVGAGVEPGSAVSSDGLTWTSAQGPSSGRFAFDGDRFVAIRGNSWVTSTHGSSWLDGGASATSSLYELARVGNQLLGFGLSAVGEVQQIVATAGSDLSASTVAPVTWSDRTFDLSPSGLGRALSIASGSSRVVVVTPTVIHVTSLPIGDAGWVDINVKSRGWALADIAWGDGIFVVVGSADAGALLATSPDGIHWQEVVLRQ